MGISFRPQRGTDRAGGPQRLAHANATANAISGTSPVSREIAIVDSDASALMTLAIFLKGLGYPITAVHSIRPIAAAARAALRQPTALVLCLDGSETVTEIQELLSSADRTRF